MAKFKTLASENQAMAKAFLNDLFVCGGLFTKSKRHDMHGDPDTTGRWCFSGYGNRSEIKSAAKQICMEILNHKFDDCDDSFATLAEYKVYSNLDGTSGSRRQLTAQKMMDYVAGFCAMKGILWPDDGDSLSSIRELDLFKTTDFGKALLAFGCFTSQDGIDAATVAVATAAKVVGTGTPAAGSTPRSSGGTGGTYKSEGPKSELARDLRSKPHEKITLSGDVIFVGGVDKARFDKMVAGGTSEAKAEKDARAVAFINTLKASCADGATNAIKFGSGHDWSDTICFFNDRAKAEEFLKKCEGICPAGVRDLKLLQRKADPNGYFIAGTTFGEVYIAANKLNEALVKTDEELEEALKTADEMCKNPGAFEVVDNDEDYFGRFTENLLSFN